MFYLNFYFFSNKPELIGFLVNKLIKHAHNLNKGGHKLIKPTNNPSEQEKLSLKYSYWREQQ